MAASDLSPALQELVTQHMASMDHVAALLALRDAPEETVTPAVVAVAVRLEPAVAERVLRDLVAARLARREGDTYQYAPAPHVRAAVDELTGMYRTKPVTLVRAIYDRPARVAQTFADAFRLRKSGE